DLPPEPIPRNTRDERVVRVNQPARESEAVYRLILPKRVQRARRTGGYAFGRRSKASAHPKLERRRLERRALLHHQRRGNLEIGERLPCCRKRFAGRLQQR